MKILIVDNGTSYLENLRVLLKGNTVKVEKFGKIGLDGADGFDLIILSGGHRFPVVGNEEKFKKEIELIRNAKPPILGICFGFELIARVFGAKMNLRGKKEKGIVDIAPSAKSVLFSGVKNFRVYESHRWVVESLPGKLVGLARSKDGVEIIKCKNSPVYGFQFHPEMFVDRTAGEKIFANLLGMIAKN